MKTRLPAKVGALGLFILMTAVVFTASDSFKTIAGNTAEVTFYVH